MTDDNPHKRVAKFTTGIYCLNLKRSPERRRKMIDQAKRLGLEINFVDADYGAVELRDLIEFDHKKPMPSAARQRDDAKPKTKRR